MMPYRYRTATLVGRWFETNEKAARDAVRAGQARFSEEDPGRLIWCVPGSIEGQLEEKAQALRRFG